MQSALLSWSGGKDSALSLYELVRTGELQVVSLLTTLTRDFDRISMHGVRRSLLEMQASSLGLPVEKVWISKNAPNAEYEEQMRLAMERWKAQGISQVVFGDLFLQDIRNYREERLARVGMHGVFPLWGRPTKELARYFVDRGFRAIVCTVDPRSLSGEFCGREYDESFLRDLPPGVDPCGENGEFHTFVYEGPIFSRKLAVKVGEVVKRDGFFFADIIPESHN